MKSLKVRKSLLICFFTLIFAGLIIFTACSKPEVVSGYKINVKKYDNGKIIVKESTAIPGDIIKIDILPNKGYELVDNTLKINDRIITGRKTFIMPAKDVNITAEFRKIKVVVVNSLSSLEGSVVLSNSAPKIGERITFQVVASKNYEYIKNTLMVNGSLHDINQGYLVQSYEINATAKFKFVGNTKSYLIDASNIKNGEIILDKKEFKEKEVVTLKIKANPGYILVKDSLKYNNILIYNIKNEEAQFIMPDRNIIISAMFEEIDKRLRILDVDKSSNLFVLSKTPKFIKNSTVELMIVPIYGYTINSKVYINEKEFINYNELTNNTIKLENVNSNIQIKANAIEKEKFTLNIENIENGKIYLLNNNERLNFYKGEKVAIQSLANDGYKLVDNSLKANGELIINNEVEINSDTTITASFIKKSEFKITLLNTENFISSNVPEKAFENDLIEIKLKPILGKTIDPTASKINTTLDFINYEEELNEFKLYFSMPNGDAKIDIALKDLKLHNLTVNNNYKDIAINLAKNNGYYAEDMVFTFTKPQNYSIIRDSFQINGISTKFKVISETEFQFKMIDEDATITYEVSKGSEKQIKYTVSRGGVFISSQNKAFPGSIITLNTTPDPGYDYVGSFVSGENILYDKFLLIPNQNTQTIFIRVEFRLKNTEVKPSTILDKNSDTNIQIKSNLILISDTTSKIYLEEFIVTSKDKNKIVDFVKINGTLVNSYEQNLYRVYRTDKHISINVALKLKPKKQVLLYQDINNDNGIEEVFVEEKLVPGNIYSSTVNDKIGYKVGARIAISDGKLIAYSSNEYLVFKMPESSTVIFNKYIPIKENSIFFNYDNLKGQIYINNEKQVNTKYKTGDTVVIRPIAKEGYTLVPGSFKINNQIIYDEVFFYVFKDEDIVIEVKFALQTELAYHNISTAINSNGVVSVGNNTSYKKGEKIKVIIKPNNGYIYEQSSLKINETIIKDIIYNNEYIFIMPDKSVTITANFIERKQNDLTLTTDENIKTFLGSNLKATFNTLNRFEIQIKQGFVLDLESSTFTNLRLYSIENQNFVFFTEKDLPYTINLKTRMAKKFTIKSIKSQNSIIEYTTINSKNERTINANNGEIFEGDSIIIKIKPSFNYKLKTNGVKINDINFSDQEIKDNRIIIKVDKNINLEVECN